MEPLGCSYILFHRSYEKVNVWLTTLCSSGFKFKVPNISWLNRCLDVIAANFVLCLSFCITKVFILIFRIDLKVVYFAFFSQDRRYGDLTEDQLPSCESLKDTIARALPFWNEEIAPEIKQGKRVLIAAHGNSLRGIVKHLEGRWWESMLFSTGEDGAVWFYP